MYRAPLRELRFVIDELLGAAQLAACPDFAEYSDELAASVLEEVLHDGIARLRAGLADRATRAAEALGTVGLRGPRQMLLTLRDAVGQEPNAASAWLDAALRIELTREVSLTS